MPEHQNQSLEVSESLGFVLGASYSFHGASQHPRNISNMQSNLSWAAQFLQQDLNQELKPDCGISFWGAGTAIEAWWEHAKLIEQVQLRLTGAGVGDCCPYVCKCFVTQISKTKFFKKSSYFRFKNLHDSVRPECCILSWLSSLEHSKWSWIKIDGGWGHAGTVNPDGTVVWLLSWRIAR